MPFIKYSKKKNSLLIVFLVVILVFIKRIIGKIVISGEVKCLKH